MMPMTAASEAARAVSMTVVGFGCGQLYFAVLKHTVADITARPGWLRPAALSLVRLGLAALLFTVAAKLGAISLLAAFLGFLAARTWAVHAAKRRHR